MTQLNLSLELIHSVLLADSYVQEGSPLKDAMENKEIEKVIQAVAQYYKEKGYVLEEEF